MRKLASLPGTDSVNGFGVWFATNAEEVRPFLDELSRALYRNCPSGVGSSGELRLDDVRQNGAKWALDHGSRASLERQPRKSVSVGPGREKNTHQHSQENAEH